MGDAEIVPVAPHETADALKQVFARLDEVERRQQVETLLAGEITHDGLWAARRDGRLVGAVYGQIQPGRTALAWPPRLAPGERPETAGRLLDVLDAQLSQCGVALTTMLLERIDPADHEVLSAGGYSFLTELLYLVAGEDDFPASEPNNPLEFEPYADANHARLVDMVKATYADTRDCPALNDARSIDDVLLGYRHTGVFAPERWRIVRHAGADVGCLIVTDHPAHASCELIYMGITAPSRGQGWGKQIARYAQWLAARAGRPRLVLAVDSQNGPALAMYHEVGFHAWDRRNVYVKRSLGPRTPDI
ncbi:MAG: GNAT family N-acetyltransferase [Pirellulales bacterium]|nr:GNAT family N-acetyltransferase [Pirellulales bacterium]